MAPLPRHSLALLLGMAGCTAPAQDGPPGAPTPAPIELEVRAAEAGRFVLLSVGDTDVGNHGTRYLEERGPDAAFLGLDPYLDADLRLLNLETTVTSDDPNTHGYELHRMRPEWLPLLSERGFSVASLANNHTMDQGMEGLEETLGWLDREGIAPVGAGMGLDDARRAVLVDTGTLRIGIVGAFERRRWGPYKRGWYADDGGGVLPLTDGPLLDDLRALDTQVDVLIVTVHWGANYVQESDELRAWARELADAGVDLIHGHGAHLVQGVEDIDGVPVLYSLGNFVFTSLGRFDEVEPELRLSVLSRFVFEGRELSAIELLPIRSDNRRTNFQPHPADEGQANEQLLPQIERHGLTWERQRDGWYRHTR